MAGSTRRSLQELSAEVATNPKSTAFVELAAAYRERGDLQRALWLCLRGLQRHPTHVEAHLNMGMALNSVGKYSQAVSHFEYILTTWPPKTSTGKGLHIHEGEECGLLLEGELHVETDGKIYHMKPGDSITLSSRTPHRVTNPGEKKAVSVWVNSIPWCFSTK